MKSRKPALTPPEGLDGEALARWQAVAPELARRGPVDAETLATYCQVWARWRQAEASIAKAGQLTRGAGGRIVASPLIGIANSTATRVRALEKRLGLDAPAPAEPPRKGKAAAAEASSPRLSRRELAERLDVHMMTITKWERDGMPIAERGAKGRPSMYDETAVRAWIQARDDAAKTGKLVDVAQERAKKERAQAALAEQTYNIRGGAYVLRADVERAIAGHFNAVKQHVLAWPTTYADRVHRAATLEGLAGVERILTQMAREGLRELEAGEYLPRNGPAAT